MKPGGRVEWLSISDAAEYLGFSSTKAFQSWLEREQRRCAAAGRPMRPRVHYLGGKRRFRRVDLDAAPEPMPESASRPTLRVIGGKA